MPRWRTLGAVSLTLLSGCVRLPPPANAHQCTVATAWSTAYAPTGRLPALAAGRVHVLRYSVRPQPTHGLRCGSITLDEQLALLRGPGQLHIAEIRKFYRGQRLVAVHRADIGRQLLASGRYDARVTLPIPGSAPFGHYTVVSLLYGKWGHGPATLLARTEAAFVIVRH